MNRSSLYVGLVSLFICVASNAQTTPESPAAQSSAAQALTAFEALSKDEQRVLAPYQKEWASLSTDTQSKLRIGAARWLTLTPEQRAAAAERAAQWQAMSPEQRAQAQAKMRNFKALPAEQRERMLRTLREFRALPPAQRNQLRREFERRNGGLNRRNAPFAPQNRWPGGGPRNGGAPNAGNRLRDLPAAERDATIAFMRSLTPEQRAIVRSHFMRLPPNQRDDLRKRLLAMTAAQRAAYFQAPD